MHNSGAIHTKARRPGCTLFVFALLVAVFSAGAAVAATLPQAASAMGRELDRQVVERLGQGESPAQGVSLCITTPVDVNDLEASMPLARQLQEEVARWFVQAGYNVQEIRKGADLLFEPATGELLLTRKDRLLGDRTVKSTAIVAGTYTVTPYNVRFNLRLVSTKNREVLAMSTMTLPMSNEAAAMVKNRRIGPNGAMGTPIEPTVVTLLP